MKLSTIRVAMAATLLFGLATFAGVQEARANTLRTPLDECTAGCANGSCEASTWAFWKDCLCGCGPAGQPSCSCDY